MAWRGSLCQKKFEKAILEFGEGLKKYPDSIKGPDNMLKLGLSFANLEKNEACNVFYELEVKYKSAPKNVLAITQKKKLDCPARNKVVFSNCKKEFEKNLSSNFIFEDQPHIGLCVSGGSDSMALVMLMRD